MPARERFPAGATPPDRTGYPDYRRFAAADRAWRRAHDQLIRARRRAPRSAPAIRAGLARGLGLHLVADAAPRDVRRLGAVIRILGAGWDGDDIVLHLTQPTGEARGVAVILSDGDTWRPALTRAGFIVAIADLPCLRALSMAHNKRRVIEGASALGQIVAEAASAIGTVIEAHGRAPWLVGGGVAATAAVLTAALDRRIAGVAVTAPAQLGHAAPYELMVPGIDRVADLAAIAGTIAPRPVVGGTRIARLVAAMVAETANQALTTPVRGRVPVRAPIEQVRPATASRDLPAWRRAAGRLRRDFLRQNAIPVAASRCVPLAQRAVSRARLADATREEIDVRTGPYAWSKLVFLRPLGAVVRRPTVLCLPGSGSDVAAVESGYAHEVVARGWNAAIIDARVALHPFLPGIAEDRPGLAQSLDDLRRVLTVVAARADVDRRHIVTFGVSQGGTHAWMLAAFDRRIAAAAPVCGLTTWTSLFDARAPFGSALDGHSPYYYFPGILAHGDQPDLCALMAPRPLLMLGATRDHWFPLAGMRACARGIRRVYALHGQSRAFRSVEFSGPHALPTTMRERAYAFFAGVFAGR